jgi:hypothetical protein
MKMIRDFKTDSPSEDARPGSRHPWTRWQLPALGLIALTVVGVTAFLLLHRFQSRSSLVSTPDMVFANPMWAMHASMEDMAGMLSWSDLAPANGANDGTPQAEMAPRFYDFGTLSKSQEVSHSFILTNRGDAPLIITNAYATCGCTSAEISAAVIPPGKAVLVTVYFSPSMPMDGSQAIRRGIILETNDPLTPKIEIWVQASIE